jgi:hypothetical protein
MAKDVISLIKLLPDELPCHLAGLCRLSCRDVSPLPGDKARSNLIKVFAYRSSYSLPCLFPASFIAKSLPMTLTPQKWHGLVRSFQLRLSYSLKKFQGIVNPTIRGWDSQRTMYFSLPRRR